MNDASRASFTPVKAARLFEEICNQIRSQVSAGAIRPGDRLPPEREMAEQFGVSRAAVREALRSLEVAGIVALKKGSKGGAFVLEESGPLIHSFSSMLDLGRITLEDFTEARILISDTLVRLACERATERDLDAMERDIDRLEGATERLEEALQHNVDLEERLQYITSFYDLLAASTGNQTLRYITHAIAQLLSQIIMEVRPRPLYQLPDLRRGLVRALRDRDPDTASCILSDHFNDLCEHIRAHEPKGVGSAGA